MNYPALLSFICGFASLSLEILWMRLYGFTKLSTPAAFGFVLMAYLIGIALGANIGSRRCRRTTDTQSLWCWSLSALVVSAGMSVLLPTIFAGLAYQGIASALLDFLCIAAASSVLAFVFPIAHHLGADSHHQGQGQRFAGVYTANVMGAGLGPLVTGYILLDVFSLQQSFAALCLLQLTAALGLAMLLQRPLHRKIIASAALGFAVTVVLGLAAVPPSTLVQYVAQHPGSATSVLENRHGIITLYPGSSAGDDIVYGGNVYDGRTNTDPERNTNGLHRPLLLAALHPQPQRVLMIGLSIGSWLTLVNMFPGVEKVDVVEINPAYAQAAQRYPDQAQALKDPRVQLINGDGRRWLRLHPENRYDLVVMNNTWHWRTNSSLLLSENFMQLLRQHMHPDALLAFNATGSGDAFYTAASVFPHTYRYDNFVYASMQDFRDRKSAPAAQKIYAQLKKSDGTPLFVPGSRTIQGFLQKPFITVEQAQLAAGRSFEKITDRNMLPEFRYGRPLY